MRIVVARYNENVDWTKEFDNVTIYNKGEPLPPEFNEIRLNNVGREGHTYYTHIVNQYDNLDNFTVFLQANPFDHSPNILEMLRRLQVNPSQFDFLSDKKIKCSMSGCNHHPGLPLQETFTALFGFKPRNGFFIFGPGAQFIVSKQKIRKHSLNFYKKIVVMLEKDINPIEGYVIERFHGIILNN